MHIHTNAAADRLPSPDPKTGLTLRTAFRRSFMIEVFKPPYLCGVDRTATWAFQPRRAQLHFHGDEPVGATGT
jgi:hypothetical protein